MDMLGVSIDKVQVYAFGFGIFFYMGEYLRPDILSKKRIPVFGCPNQVYPNVDVRHSCGSMGAKAPGWFVSFIHHPALKDGVIKLLPMFLKLKFY